MAAAYARRAQRRRAEHESEPGPTITREVAAPAAAVWSVLADGWSYANWVVGAARVRAVDAGWPSQDARVHHSVGLWPVLINDFTTVSRVTPGEDLVLTARAWPAGEAQVHFTVQPVSAEQCLITVTEDAVTGPGRFIPPRVRHVLLAPRNREMLHRLALLAEGQYRAG